MAATTGQLGLVTPTQGDLSGTWGNTVNNGITEYTNIAIAGTLSFADDGAITLANTTGDASATNIGSTTAQYAVIRITGTQTVVKVITGPSYSKLYMVDHAGATSAVTFKAAGQSGVSIAVGEKCFVYYNGTDYVKVASTAVAGIVGPANGGTGIANNAASTLTISGSFATTLTVSGATGVTLPTTGTLATLAGSETFSNKTLTAPALGTPASGNLTSCTADGTNKVGYLNIPQVGSAKVASYTLVVGDVGKFVVLGTSGTVVVPASIFAVGDAISIANNTAAGISCTTSAVTAYLGGTNTVVTSFTLASRGVCNILYVTASVVFITGNVA